MGKVPENSIHVTGFGPFRNFTKSNPSWEAVSLLPNNIVHSGQSILIVKHEVPVTYAAVDQKVHEIWSSKPKVSIDIQNFLIRSENAFFHRILNFVVSSSL